LVGVSAELFSKSLIEFPSAAIRSWTFVLFKYNGKYQPKNCNRYTHKKRKRNPKTTLNILRKSQLKTTKEEGMKKIPKVTIQNNKMALNRHLSIITLNEN